MKISDPLGKVYTHTMFKKKSYELRGDGDSEQLEEDDHDHDVIHTISAEHHRSMDPSEDDEDEDANSDIEDSLSTKSSRILRHHSTSSRRNRDSSRARTVVSPFFYIYVCTYLSPQ